MGELTRVKNISKTPQRPRRITPALTSSLVSSLRIGSSASISESASNRTSSSPCWDTSISLCDPADVVGHSLRTATGARKALPISNAELAASAIVTTFKEYPEFSRNTITIPVMDSIDECNMDIAIEGIQTSVEKKSLRLGM